MNKWMFSWTMRLDLFEQKKILGGKNSNTVAVFLFNVKYVTNLCKDILIKVLYLINILICF